MLLAACFAALPPTIGYHRKGCSASCMFCALWWSKEATVIPTSTSFAVTLSQFLPYGRHALSHQHTMQGVTVLPWFAQALPTKLFPGKNGSNSIVSAFDLTWLLVGFYDVRRKNHECTIVEALPPEHGISNTYVRMPSFDSAYGCDHNAGSRSSRLQSSSGPWNTTTQPPSSR